MITYLLQGLSVVLLFILFYIAMSVGIHELVRRFRRRSGSLRQFTAERDEGREDDGLMVNPTFQRIEKRSIRVVYGHLSNVLESVRSDLKAGHFFLVTFILLLLGFWGGIVLFASIKGMLILGSMLASSPYLWLRVKLLNMQMSARLEFLPAVEVFYQQYLIAEGKNFRNTLKRSLEENRIRYPIKPVFEQLYRNLSTDRGIEQSVNLFALSLGHIWARYFANMVLVSLTEGVDISGNLQELITDMRKAQIASQVERNKLLEIRIASFSPILFLVIFITINLRLNYEQAYHYYFVHPAGRNLLLEALALIFASFVMGFYLSQRKM